MEVTPPPPRQAPKMDQSQKKSTKNYGAPWVLSREPQPHQIFHQPYNVEPQWACMCKRQAHSEANTDNER